MLRSWLILLTLGSALLKLSSLMRAQEPPPNLQLDVYSVSSTEPAWYPPLPSMRDAPLPDLGTMVSPPPKSRVLRKLKELVPTCVNTTVHTCWDMPVGEEVSAKERKFQKNMEVADYYRIYKNYPAAADRYREALSYKPDDPLLNFRLGECLEKSNKPAEARVYYEAYLRLAPDGSMAGKAKKAVSKIAAKSSSQPFP